MWLPNPLICLKTELHILHSKGIKLVCSILWLFNAGAVLKVFSHWMHWYGLSPVCSSKWWFRRPDNLNSFSQCGQENIDFSTAECANLCEFRANLQLNILLHIKQLNGFSPVCFMLCFFKCSNLLNDWSHWPQGKGLSFVPWTIILRILGQLRWFSKGQESFCVFFLTRYSEKGYFLTDTWFLYLTLISQESENSNGCMWGQSAWISCTEK